MERMLNDTVDIETRTLAPDGLGSQTEAWSVKRASIPCRVRTAGATQRKSGGSPETVYTHTFYCMPTSLDERTDRLRRDGVVYEIVAIVQPSGRAGLHHLQIDALEVR